MGGCGAIPSGRTVRTGSPDVLGAIPRRGLPGHRPASETFQTASASYFTMQAISITAAQRGHGPCVVGHVEVDVWPREISSHPFGRNNLNEGTPTSRATLG